MAESESGQRNGLSVIPANANEFESPNSGTKYFVTRDMNELSVKRYEELEKMLVELQFTMTHEELMHNLNEQAKAIRDSDIRMISVINYNLMSGLADMQNKHTVTLWICTLYITREGEDVTAWDLNVAREKIADWSTNFQVGFFLSLRDTLFQRLMSLSHQLSHNSEQIIQDKNFTERRIEKLNTKYPPNTSSY